MDWKKLEEISKAIAKSHWAQSAGFVAAMTGFTWTVCTITGADKTVKKYLRVTKDDDSRVTYDHPISHSDATALGH